ncbi:unnamed protein product [Linum tenue]|uniref:FHA domain-containing protein n=1 Tax=Linum tenue TaxID=586396 RepID=A0AAV0N1P6_9ROSI|nr:unnamed protein product [Linum tenue]
MEAAAGGRCLQYHSAKPSLVAAATASASSSSSIPLKTSSSFLKGLRIKGRNQLPRKQSTSTGFPRVVVQASSAAETTSSTTTSAVQERWILVPVGDGDTRHIGFEVKMPGAFEIASNEVTVGRVPEKANMVIPVATVSGVHARIQKKGGNLLVTDLDSTNGTFIGDKRLRPGVASTLVSGNVVIFGDIHLAMFRASKLENVEVAASNGSSTEEGEATTETEKSTESTSS